MAMPGVGLERGRAKMKTMAALWSVLLIVFFAAGPVQGVTPSQQLKQSMDDVIALVGEHHPIDSSKQLMRKNQIFKILENRFDFGEMARRMLGDHYLQLSDGERAEFDLVFSRLVEETLVQNLECSRGQQVQIVREKAVGDKYYYVSTEVAGAARVMTVDYFLRYERGQWLVCKIDVDGVPLMHVYRARFRRAIRENRFQALMGVFKARMDGHG